MIIVVVTTIELGGFMGLFGVKVRALSSWYPQLNPRLVDVICDRWLNEGHYDKRPLQMNPISAVTLICAVGIGVEFTAHVVLAFLTSLGSVETRLQVQ